MSFGTRQPDVSHLTRLTCPLAPAGLFLPECLLFFTIAAVLALRLMRLRLLPSSALPWRSASLGAKSRGGGWGDRACSVKISVYRSHIALDFSNLPPHKGLAAPRAETRTARPEIYTRGTRNSFFFLVSPQGGPEVHRAGARDGPKHTLRRHDGGREDQVRRRRERRARERESVLRRRGIGREVGCGHAGAATLVRVPVTPETSREQPAPAWPRHRRVWRAAFLVPFGRRLRQ